MTDAGTATRGDNGNTGSGSSLLDALPTDRLLQAGRTLVSSVAERAVDVALERIDGLTEKLTGVAENGGVGLGSALGGGKAMMQGENPIKGALSGGFSAIKNKVTGALGMGGGDDEDGEGEGEDGSGGGGGDGGARGKLKFMNIKEEQDVGVPIRVAYDQWTQFADFPSFMKKVESVEQESDEKVNWKAQVFWSHRTWETTIVEQVPDSHIIWRSTGAKGRADGVVAFGEIASNMTRIVLVMEYYPQGFFEKTANLWRAVGRRARLEFKHFGRHVMMDTLLERDELEGWRGEIRDSEVVKTHEEAMQEEQDALEEEGADDELEPGEEQDELDDDELEDDELEDDELDDDESAEDVDADDELDEDDDEGSEDADEDADDASEDAEPEQEPARRSRRSRRRESAST